MSTLVRLESKRMILRQAVPIEAEELVRFFSKNKKFHKRPDRPASFYTKNFWKKQIKNERNDFEKDQGITLYLFLKEKPNEVIGEVVFDKIIRGVFQSCFLGYLLGEEYEGKGLMTEALRTAIPYLFTKMNLHRVSAAHVPENKKSCRVLNKLEFKVIGLEPKYLRINKKWRDHELHVLINNRWKHKKSKKQ